MRTLKKFLQRVFKNLFQFFFKLIYGKIVYVSNNLSSNNILIEKIKSKNIIKFNNEAYQVYKIKKGRIYTDIVENVVRT